jgi:hypothetical protein
VTTYLASAAPQALHAKCPCWVFGASTDGGRKYQRHIIPVAAGSKSLSGLFSGIYADPSKPGHYIFLTHTHGAGGRVEVYETDDTGLTWSGPNSIVEVPGASVGDLTAQSTWYETAATYPKSGSCCHEMADGLSVSR